MSDPLEFAKDLALRTGARLRQGIGEPMNVRFKGPRDLVTEMDTVAERLIVDALARRFPDHAILAEESGAHPGGDFRWLVDPLDGTVNYAHRWPHWAVSIALEHRGVPVLAVVYAPACGELFWAERGKGAYKDGRRLEVSNVSGLDRALLVVGSVTVSPDLPLPEQPIGRLMAAVLKVRQTGVASLDLAWLAMGRVDACHQGHTTPWDVAAGKLLVEEAGGRLTRADGGAFALTDPSFVASNGTLHEELVGVLSWPHDERRGQNAEGGRE